MHDSDWDAFVEEKNGSLLQTATWGTLKAAFGWHKEVVTLRHEGGRLRAGALVLFRELPTGLATIAYVPRGPIVDWRDEPTVDALLHAIRQRAKAQRAAFLKVEPNLPHTEANARLLERHGFRRSPQTVQPPTTIVIDVNADDDTIMARMNQGTRRKIRQSRKKGVEIRRGTLADVEPFNRLTEITSERNEFGVHDPDYYRTAFRLFAPGRAALFMASYEGLDIAGLMAFKLGERAYYLYGASSNKERNRMPTYGLQWAAIAWAREQGCTTYDMWGIPDEDEETLEAQFTERRDGLWGVYGFKRGFGGRVVRHVGAWDLPYSGLLYNAYQFVMARRSG